MPTSTPTETSVVGEPRREKPNDAILATTEERLDNVSDKNPPAYLEGWDLWYLGMALMSSAFVLSLDNTILGTYLPPSTLPTPI